MIETFNSFKRSNVQIRENFGQGYDTYYFEYVDKQSRGRACKCSGEFVSLQHAIDFFGFETDPDIVSWKQVDENGNEVK